MNTVLNIVDFGAIADAKTINTVAIQKAIDECPVGGTVLIPDGTFISGALFLKGDMTLCVDGRLQGSDNLKDYPVMIYRYEGLEQKCYASLVGVKGDMDGEQIRNPHSILHRNIKICGKGTIDGAGTVLFETEMGENAGKRGRTLCIRNTDGIEITGVKVRHSPSWCLHLIYCHNVHLHDMEIHSKYDENGKLYEKIFNNDGLDLDSCDNCLVENCLIASGDDCIAIKSGRDKEGRDVGIMSQNIVIKNSTFKHGWGVVIGSEMSGGVRNVLVEDCKFEDTFSFGGAKAPRGRGSIVENITYRNIEHYRLDTHWKDCKWFRGSLYVDMYYSLEVNDHTRPEELSDKTPTFRNLVFENINSETYAGNGIFICGLPENHIQNVKLKNVHVKAKHGIELHNVDGLDWEDVTQEII